jgi:hypothetical protein
MLRQPLRIAILAALSLAGCGDVAAIGDAGGSAGRDAPSNPCAPSTCLLSDDFGGTSLDMSTWSVSVGGGATVTVANGTLTLHLPAAIDAFADVASLVGFPVGTTFEARVTFSASQFYDHKGAGFASMRIGSQCDTGETDAAMFRGQDGDAYVETRSGGGTAACTLTTQNYPAGTNTMRISRAADQVVFTENNVMLAPVKIGVPMGLLPVRFSAYTFTTAPAQPVQIDIDYVRVMRP